MKIFTKITRLDLMLFSKELSILIKSGLPIVSCLKILTEHTSNNKFKNIILDIKNQVEAGSSLSDAFSSHTKVFPKFYATSINAGEVSDTISDVLMFLYEYLNFANNLRKKIISALVYPAFLFVITFFAVFYLLIFVVPVFSKLYAEMGQNLPYLTTILIGVSNTIKSNFILIILILVIIRVILKYLIKIYENKIIIDRIKLNMPLIGGLLKKYIFAYFFTTLATLLKSGVPLPKALEGSISNLDNTYVYDKMNKVVQLVNGGLNLALAFKNTGIVEGIAIEMIHTGEETGSLEDMLNSISSIYEEEVNATVSTLLTILEPLLMLIMGILIGTILLTMYLPIFEMSARF